MEMSLKSDLAGQEEEKGKGVHATRTHAHARTQRIAGEEADLTLR